MNISSLALAAKRCQDYGSYSALVGGLYRIKKYYTQYHSNTTFYNQSLPFVIEREFGFFGKSNVGDITEILSEVFQYSGNTAINAFIASAQKGDKYVTGTAMVITPKENNRIIAVNKTRYSITHESLRNKFNQSTWVETLIIGNGGEGPSIYHRSNHRTSFNRNSFINVLSKIYAPIYFDVFKLSNNFSQNMNEYLLKEFAPKKNSHRISKRSRITPVRG